MDGTTTTRSTGSTRAALIVGALVALLLTQLALVTNGGGSASFAFDTPQLATQLGVSAVMAEKLMNVLGSWYFTVLIGIATGGWGAGLVRIAVSMATKYGKKYAIAW